MMQEKINYAIRLRHEGYSLREASRMAGVRPGTVSSHCSTNGILIGRVPVQRPTKLTGEQVSEAERRHSEGEKWESIAKSFGVSRNTIRERICEKRGLPSRDRSRSEAYRGNYSSPPVEPWRKRTVTRIIKPASEVNELAKMFVSGKISRSEFVMRIRA